MKNFSGIFWGVFLGLSSTLMSYAEKFEVLPDLPEQLSSAAQASSISTVDNTNNVTAAITSQTVGQEPNFFSVVLSLLFVILLIYATGIIYTKLNKVGLNTMRKHIDDSDDSRATVISTTPLGNNKTLHVVELDGKRMLIGASSNSIDLIKDLGEYPHQEYEEGEYSKIEIPNIRIPKIEIPKIEFPNIGFTKTFKKDDTLHAKLSEEQQNSSTNSDDKFEISEIYEESSDGIIDKLFIEPKQKENKAEEIKKEEKNTHSVDPEEYALYKKYL